MRLNEKGQARILGGVCSKRIRHDKAVFFPRLIWFKGGNFHLLSEIQKVKVGKIRNWFSHEKSSEILEKTFTNCILNHEMLNIFSCGGLFRKLLIISGKSDFFPPSLKSVKKILLMSHLAHKNEPNGS